MRKICIVFLAAVLLGAAIFSLFSASEKKASVIKIGVSDNLGGVLVHYLLQEKGFGGNAVQQSFDAYSLNDCCSSSAQWALSSEALDIALLCPDAARTLVEKDGRYEILGPCLANSDVVVIRTGISPKSIGVAQNRTYQEQLLRAAFGTECETVNVLAAGLPYAFEKGAVDGVVVDAVKSFTLAGGVILPPATDAAQVTAVLVVRKSFKDDPRFKQFMALYAQAVSDLNQPDALRDALRKYKSLELKQEEIETWNRLRISFLSVPEVPR